MEYRLQRADGEYRWVLDNGVPRFESGGVFAGYMGSCADITELKQAQAELFDRHLLKNLRVLTGGIAHDFSNLMSTILATAELADAEIGDGVFPAGPIQTIKSLASRAVEIVRELMIYAGQDKGTFVPVDVPQLVEEMLGLLKSSISKRANVITDLPADLPAVWGNPTHIRQIVMNLIINASDALGDKGGDIKVSASTVKRSHGSQSDGRVGFPAGDCLRLEVSDTGCGMSEALRAKMFDPYFTTKRTGHGLGLAVVHAIVQSHSGAINVVSTLGKGTTLEVFLPLAHRFAAGEAMRMAAHDKEGHANEPERGFCAGI
jgi:signal transduction histidine kinase